MTKSPAPKSSSLQPNTAHALSSCQSITPKEGRGLQNPSQHLPNPTLTRHQHVHAALNALLMFHHNATSCQKHKDHIRSGSRSSRVSLAPTSWMRLNQMPGVQHGEEPAHISHAVGEKRVAVIFSSWKMAQHLSLGGQPSASPPWGGSYLGWELQCCTSTEGEQHLHLSKWGHGRLCWQCLLGTRIFAFLLHLPV